MTDKQALPKQFVSWVKKNFKEDEIDTIDWYAEYDRTLLLGENIQILKNKYKPYIKDDIALLEEVEHYKATEEKKTFEKQKQIADEEAELIQNWKNQPIERTDVTEFEIAKHLILTTIRGFASTTILTGEGGIGKTYCVIQLLKSELKPEDWEYASGFTTPLALYKFLYKNKDKKVVCCDDLEGLFSDDKAISLLKSAMWSVDGKRLVSYNTTSDKATDVPSCFELQAKLILLCNKIPNEQDINTQAMLSRTIHYKLQFSYPQIKAIMRKILDKRTDINEEAKKFVMDTIDKETGVTTKNFSLRTLEHLISFVKYDQNQAVTLLKNTTETDEEMKIVLELIESKQPIGEQIALFYQRTNKSRATFFRIKQRIKTKMGIK